MKRLGPFAKNVLLLFLATPLTSSSPITFRYLSFPLTYSHLSVYLCFLNKDNISTSLSYSLPSPTHSLALSFALLITSSALPLCSPPCSPAHLLSSGACGPPVSGLQQNLCICWSEGTESVRGSRSESLSGWVFQEDVHRLSQCDYATLHKRFYMSLHEYTRQHFSIIFRYRRGWGRNAGTRFGLWVRLERNANYQCRTPNSEKTMFTMFTELSQ